MDAIPQELQLPAVVVVRTNSNSSRITKGMIYDCDQTIHLANTLSHTTLTPSPGIYFYDDTTPFCFSLCHLSFLSICAYLSSFSSVRPSVRFTTSKKNLGQYLILLDSVVVVEDVSYERFEQ